jgi:isopenicillin-N N-acyltransferase-like protein
MNCAMSKIRRWLRRLSWTAGILVALLLLLYLGMLGLMYRWVAHPPLLAQQPMMLQESVKVQGERVYLGRNWFERRDGLPVLYLTGTPFEMGYANGVLTEKYIHRQEDAVLDLLHQVVPYQWTQFVLKFLVTYKNRHLSDAIPEAYRMEIFGLSRGCPDAHPSEGPFYHRILNYHAAQDISYMLMNSPLIRGGCTAFGAWSPVTRDGHLLLGRNFDWEAAPVFDEDRMVIICEPDEGIPFISLAWSGMAGCVSAMNRAGLAVTVNGAPSQLPADTGAPTCIVARDVVQHATNIAEALAIIRRYRVFVSAQFLVGSRQDGRFVVVEKTPEQTVVREPFDAGFTVCANHYMTAALTNDPVNLTYMQADTSLPRYARMAELLQRNTGTLDATQSASILRNRELPGDRFAGNGHRSSLNPLIATHSVIMDLTEGIFWAATPPHQLGKFVAFDLNRTEQPLPERTLAEDPLKTGGEFQRYLAAQQKLAEGWRALKQGQPDQALDCARQAETNNPGFYQNDWLLAEVLFRQGKYPEAAAAGRKAMDGKPALGSERRQIEQLLTEAETHK